MKLAHDIVIAPVISEKSLDGVAAKRYTFKVAKDSTKVEIAKAVEEIFGVKVTKVNTISVKGRFKRMGRNEGYKPDWKKAIVTLSEDSKTIELFEGMV